MNILAFAAHPDDVEEMCFGTLMKYHAQGDQIYIVLSTSGNIGSNWHDSREELAAIREKEQLEAAKPLDAKVKFLRFDDEGLQDTAETRKAFLNAIRWANPDVIFTHNPKDTSTDHAMTSKLITEVLLVVGGKLVPTEEPPITKVPSVFFWDIPAGFKFDPQIFVDITDVMEEKIAAIVHFIRGHREQSGIIYCMRRNDTTELADELAMYNIKAIAYHAGLLPAQREQAQNDFINDRVDVVCATVAFGMGIDKSNVRWVVHYSMPGSIENYYQEIGRAGRDGMKSDTLLFYSLSDLIVLRRFAEESGQSEVNLEKLNRMRRYCESDMCRRRVLLSYFGEEADHDCGNCDVCKNPPQRFDGSVLIQKALSAVIRTGEHVGMQMLIDILRASGRAELLERGYDKLKTYGAGRDLSYKEWKEYIYQMIQLGYMEIDYAAERVLRMTPLGRRVLYGEQKAQLVIYREPDELTRPVRRGERKSSFKAQPIRPIRSASTDETLLDSLRQLRKQIAEREHTPAYIIFSDDSLEDMVEKKPVTLDQFSDIRGVGQIKLDRYGKVFVALIRFVLKLPK